MKIIKYITNWLEIRASTPTYSGWVLGGVAICFFGAAMNTMAGWLYAISGVSFALLFIAAVLPPRSLFNLIVKRHPIQAVTAGDDLKIELDIINPTKKAVNLLQVADVVPFILGKPQQQAIETILPQNSYHWVYYYPTERRGIYRWQTVELASGAPLGLFWCRRQRECTAKAIVYPTVLNLTSCPLVDRIGQEDSRQGDPRGVPLQTANEGLVRSLRPYRIGDPMRLIHWRSSARYGELRIRELEIVTAGQQMVIALDSSGKWEESSFEGAVIAAASLYIYAQKQQIQIQLWTASTGLVKGDRVVMETLAATNSGEDATNLPPTSDPLIWLTQNPSTLCLLPSGSRWLLWQSLQTPTEQVVVNRDYPGIVVQPEQPLQLQLQQADLKAGVGV
ncbi:DUF58 domain-containing protein [Pelatocladus sp. BLCC-F211]|uniref:DUF58 domain-containing protein n=1 Tax=Pelatocladus sp. BLCC-F211 TaxID=3342752 RepID=UPI0035B869D7